MPGTDRFVHLCTTREIVQPVDLWSVRWLTEDDHEAFAQPFQKGQERGLTLEEFRQLQNEGYSYCGIVLDGRLCSIAGLWKRAPDVWEVIAVGTKEEYRRREMAKCVVYFIADHILQHVKAASYTSRKSNIASVRTALSVGFRYCTSIVDNDKWCANDPRPVVDNTTCPLKQMATNALNFTLQT